MQAWVGKKVSHSFMGRKIAANHTCRRATTVHYPGQRGKYM